MFGANDPIWNEDIFGEYKQHRLDWFKEFVKESAQEAAKEEAQGHNAAIYKIANLIEVERYVKDYGVDTEELKQFVKDTYAEWGL